MPRPDATAEEFEASAHRYSDACFLLLRLSTGRFALFNRRFQLLAIDTLEELGKREDLNTYRDPWAKKPAEDILKDLGI